MDFHIFDSDSHQPIPSDDPDPRLSNVYHKSEVSSGRSAPATMMEGPNHRGGATVMDAVVLRCHTVAISV
jgi:hypothetical protein